MNPFDNSSSLNPEAVSGSAKSIPWDTLYAQYTVERSAFLADDEQDEMTLEFLSEAVRRLGFPESEDLQWLTKALEHSERKWFVAAAAKLATSMGESLFVPMLDAGINEINPSFNRCFIDPCSVAYGQLRVNEYLLKVVESDTDFRKAGAVNAMYWAQRVPRPFDDSACEHALKPNETPEAINNMWKRKKMLLLETFLTNPNVDVRRSIIPKLDLKAASYPESHRMLVDQAINIARSSSDDYIRHRVEVQLGTTNLLHPLPHRKT